MSFRPLAAAAAPVALAVAGGLTATFSVDSTSRASSLFLTLMASAVLAVLALSSPPRSRIVPIAALGAFAALAFLPRAVPLPAAALALLMAAAIGFSLIERARADGSSHGFRAILGPVAAGQLWALAPEIFLAPRAASTWLALVVPALLTAILLTAAARRRPEAAVALGLASFAAGPGWGLAGCAGVALGSLLVALGTARRRPSVAALGVPAGALAAWSGSGPVWLALAVTSLAALALVPARSLRRAAFATLGTAAALALVGGALPWRRERPLEAVLVGALAAPFRTVETPVRGRSVVLDAASPRFEAPLAASAAGAVVVVSYLTNSVELPCGTPVARVVLERAGTEVVSETLEVGRDTSEWAATRPDVARVIACPSPPPSWSWIPASGRHLGSTYRSRIAWSRPVAVDRLRLERDPTLPERVGLAVFRVGVER